MKIRIYHKNDRYIVKRKEGLIPWYRWIKQSMGEFSTSSRFIKFKSKQEIYDYFLEEKKIKEHWLFVEEREL